MISLLLLTKIAQLFLGLILGFILVRTKILNTSDTRVLSAVALYAVTPCLILSVFQTEISSDLLTGLLLSLGAAVGAHLLFFILAAIFKKPCRLTPTEQANCIYTNSGDLVIPVVSALFGPEWLIYSLPFSVVQLPLFWSHCLQLVSGEAKISWKKMLLNVNIISVFVGALLFFFRIPLPAKLMEAMEPIGNMIGPMSMIIAGMLIGGMDLRKVFSFRGIWKVAALRLLVFPLVALAIIKFSGVSALVSGGETILLISLLAMCAPAAGTVTQQSILFGTEGEYSGAIYTVTTLLCVLTMPLMIALYQL